MHTDCKVGVDRLVHSRKMFHNIYYLKNLSLLPFVISCKICLSRGYQLYGG